MTLAAIGVDRARGAHVLRTARHIRDRYTVLDLAADLGVTPYLRAGTTGVAPAFIGALAQAVRAAVETPGVHSFGPGCRADFAACPCRFEGTPA